VVSRVRENMNNVQYGANLTGTANDIAFALSILNDAGFAISRPTPVDFRNVACRMLGTSDDVGIEDLVTTLAQVISEFTK